MIGDEIEVQLYKNRSESLNINSTWHQMADNTKQVTTDKSAVQYMKNKLQSAQWFIHAVQQREATMMKIMQGYRTLQYDYFINRRY